MPFPGAAVFPGPVVFPGAAIDGPGVDVTVTARIVGPWVIEEESVDFIELDVRVNSIVTAAYEISVAPDPQRPVAWVSPHMLGMKYGLLAGPYAPGLHQVFVRVSSTPEMPVVTAGVLFVRGAA